MPPRQVTPEVAAAQLVADASQGEAEQAMILEVDPSMTMVVGGLMMVTDQAHLETSTADNMMTTEEMDKLEVKSVSMADPASALASPRN